MPCLNNVVNTKKPQSEWGNPKKESVPIFTNETPMVVEIEQKKSKEPIQMLEKTGEKKYKPGERLIKESKKLQGGKKEKPEKRNYKNSISELLEELFV